jgi:hypothetical protein
MVFQLRPDKALQRIPVLKLNWLENCMVVMMSNKALGDRSPETRRLTVEELAGGDTLLSHFIRRALDANYRPPDAVRLFPLLHV